MSAQPFVMGVSLARGGSKGIPRKNLRLVGGKPLIAWTIEAALASKSLRRMIVSTDDDEIAEVASRWGSEVLARPAALATDDASAIDALGHVLGEVEADVVVLLQPTSPIRRPGLIDRCVTRFLETGADSLATGAMLKLYPYGSYTAPRQAIDSWFHDDGNVYVFRADLLRRGERYGERRETMVISRTENVEIDDDFDLWIADMILDHQRFTVGVDGLWILGDSDHARVVAEAAQLSGVTVKGFVSLRPGAAPVREPSSPPVLTALPESATREFAGDALALGIGDAGHRASAYDAAMARGLRIVPVVHPTAAVSPSASIGAGAFVAAGSVVGPGVRLAEGSIVNSGATVDHDCDVGAFTQVGPGSHLNGRVRIGRSSLIGVGASVVQGIVVGDHAVVGAGSVVTRPVSDGVRAWGVPARVRSDD